MMRHRQLEALREGLFGGPVNSAITIGLLVLLGLIAPPLVEWALLNAVWAGEAAACRAAPEGACWAFVAQNIRFMLFGTYPFEEQGRPLAALLIFLAVLGLSTRPFAWKPWLGWVWLLAFLAMGLLLSGGVGGMTHVPTRDWGGLVLTLILAVIGCAAAFPFAIALALGRRSELPVVRGVCVLFIELIRGVPLITLLFMAAFLFPLFLPTGVSIDQILRAQIAIILFLAAYLAEVIRGGLQALPQGQQEAAESLGLGYWRIQAFIILPQALRISIPGIVNQFIATFKDTSLVAIIGLIDLMGATRGALADAQWRPYFVEAYLFAAFIYFAFCFGLSKTSRSLERRLDTARA